jgi:hypothetical protein
MPCISGDKYSRYTGLERKRLHTHDFFAMHNIVPREHKSRLIQRYIILEKTRIGGLTNKDERRGRMNFLRLVAVFVVILTVLV